MATADRYRDHLRRQLGFLERSCASYDLGHRDEAIRIAVILRVLLHDTSRSISLLTHLGKKDIQLLSTVAPIHPGAFAAQGMGLYQSGTERVDFRPPLGDGWYGQPLQAEDWWQQVVAVLPGTGRIARKDIILAAANKDGGAHVDPALTAEYELLARDGALGSFVHRSPEGERVEPVTAAHLVYLRQMGYEILNSAELRSLAV